VREEQPLPGEDAKNWLKDLVPVPAFLEMQIQGDSFLFPL
jgi:hypothetical protein